MSERFTIVFEGDIRTFDGNPLKTETSFGIPYTVAVGDIVEQFNELQDSSAGAPSLPASRPTDAQTASACMSYRHDFGLLDTTAKKNMMWQAHEWLRAWQKEFETAAPPVRSAATTETHRHQAECERYGRGGGVRRAFFIIVEPGKVPVGKGPFITFDQVEKFARDAIEHHPQPDTHIIRCELTWNDELWVQCAREQAEIDAALDGVDWDEVDAELARNDRGSPAT